LSRLSAVCLLSGSVWAVCFNKAGLGLGWACSVIVWACSCPQFKAGSPFTTTIRLSVRLPLSVSLSAWLLSGYCLSAVCHCLAGLGWACLGQLSGWVHLPGLGSAPSGLRLSGLNVWAGLGLGSLLGWAAVLRPSLGWVNLRQFATIGLGCHCLGCLSVNVWPRSGSGLVIVRLSTIVRVWPSRPSLGCPSVAVQSGSTSHCLGWVGLGWATGLGCPSRQSVQSGLSAVWARPSGHCLAGSLGHTKAFTQFVKVVRRLGPSGLSGLSGVQGWLFTIVRLGCSVGWATGSGSGSGLTNWAVCSSGSVQSSGLPHSTGFWAVWLGSLGSHPSVCLLSVAWVVQLFNFRLGWVWLSLAGLPVCLGPLSGFVWAVWLTTIAWSVWVWVQFSICPGWAVWVWARLSAGLSGLVWLAWVCLVCPSLGLAVHQLSAIGLGWVCLGWVPGLGCHWVHNNCPISCPITIVYQLLNCH